MKNSTTTIAALTFGTLVSIVDAPKNVSAHGTMLVPESRIYKCRFNGNPENHSDAACRAAVELGGTQPLYDWNSIRQGDANGQHRDIIPDGQLCSGGNSTFRGMDLLRSDWQATTIAPDANGQFEFVYYATAPHATQDMIFYITPLNWNATQPLRFDDMQEFCRLGQIPLVDLAGGKKGYKMICDLPQRSGKHVIFNIWQRSDSPEAFYSCSDVNFNGSDDNGFKQLGTVVAMDPLSVGTKLTFRLLDEASSDVETIEMTVQDNQGASNLWPFFLAQTVNTQSQFIRIGILSESGDVEPTQLLNGNIVYSLSGGDFTFVIDKQIPDNPNRPSEPNPTDDDSDVTFDFLYSNGIGQYSPGTIVKGTDDNRYQCKPFPFSGWCNQAPLYYEPAKGLAWEDAWFRL